MTDPPPTITRRSFLRGLGIGLLLAAVALVLDDEPP